MDLFRPAVERNHDSHRLPRFGRFHNISLRKRNAPKRFRNDDPVRAAIRFFVSWMQIAERPIGFPREKLSFVPSREDFAGLWGFPWVEFKLS